MSRWIVLAIGGVVGLVALVLGAGSGRAHEPYTKWLSNHGIKCCSDLERECRRVRSKWNDDIGMFQVLHEGQWLIVAASAVLKMESPDGDSHACIRKNTALVDCFVNGRPKI